MQLLQVTPLSRILLRAGIICALLRCRCKMILCFFPCPEATFPLTQLTWVFFFTGSPHLLRIIICNLLRYYYSESEIWQFRTRTGKFKQNDLDARQVEIAFKHAIKEVEDQMLSSGDLKRTKFSFW